MTKRVLIVVHPLYLLRSKSKIDNLPEYISQFNRDISSAGEYLANLEKAINKFDQILIFSRGFKKINANLIDYFIEQFNVKGYSREDIQQLITLLSSPKIKRIPLPTGFKFIPYLKRIGAWNFFCRFIHGVDEIYIAGGNLLPAPPSESKPCYEGCVMGVLYGIRQAKIEKTSFPFIRMSKIWCKVVMLEDVIFPISDIRIPDLVNAIHSSSLSRELFDTKKKNVKNL